MAARKRLTHNQKTRDKIQTSMLVQRIEKFIETDQETGIAADGTLGVKMTGPQVTAAMGLLKKTIPDLSSVELAGKDGDDIKVATRIELIGVSAKH